MPDGFLDSFGCFMDSDGLGAIAAKEGVFPTPTSSGQGRLTPAERIVEVIARANSQYGRGFKWTEAVQAFCVLFLKYAAWCAKGARGASFEFTTAEDPNHAKSLDHRMDRERDEKSWVAQVFGERDHKGRTPLEGLQSRYRQRQPVQQWKSPPASTGR